MPVSDLIEKIDLIKLFEELRNESYCLVKRNAEFPTWRIGSDIDIFCYSSTQIGKVIVRYVSSILSDEFLVEVTNLSKQMYVDIIRNRVIQLRFDLYDDLPEYRSVNIKKAFFSSIIENSAFENIRGASIRVPCLVDDLIIRYIEYHEWYNKRPDKIKHLDYVYAKIENEQLLKKEVLDKLHFYTALPQPAYKPALRARWGVLDYAREQFARLQKARKIGVKGLLIMVKDRLQRK